MKIRAAAEVGVKAEHIKLSDDTNQYELSQMVEKLNNDTTVHGIIVQVWIIYSSRVLEFAIKIIVQDRFRFRLVGFGIYDYN